jgi:uncharacterized protein (DUF1697 family)
MTSATHLVLIRGINVGGRNKVPMAELRAALDAAGLGPVTTYIQSGNALVRSEDSPQQVADAVADVLRREFDVDTVVVVLTAEDLLRAVAEAPDGFGADTDTYKHDVIFVDPAITPAEAFDAVDRREGVDEAWVGSVAVYIRRVSALVAKSYLSKVTQSPHYQHMTIRNWRTTTTLAGMLDAP